MNLNRLTDLIDSSEAVCEAYADGVRNPALIAEMYLCLRRSLVILIQLEKSNQAENSAFKAAVDLATESIKS